MAPTVFFHVGTGKTGTTFLQYRVFPKLRGIHYLQRTLHRRYVRILNKRQHDRYLLSREYDQQLEAEIAAFTEHYPDITPIIVFRKHDSYIASQYRRFVKNGFRGTFRDFFDMARDQGRFRMQDLDYRYQLGLLEQYFTQPPIVLLYEDMRRDPRAFVQALADRIGATVDLDSIDFSKKHASYNLQQLKTMQRMGRYVDMRKRRVFRNGVANFLWKLGIGAVRYTTLYVGKLLPASAFDEAPLIDPTELTAVAAHYREDWAYVRERAVRV